MSLDDDLLRYLMTFLFFFLLSTSRRNHWLMLLLLEKLGEQNVLFVEFDLFFFPQIRKQ